MPDRLAAAAQELGGAARRQTVDVTDDASLAAFFDGLDRVDHLFTPAASYRVGALRELSPQDAETPFTSKFWGQYHAAASPRPASVPADGGLSPAVRPPWRGGAMRTSRGCRRDGRS
ncbi:hypothetical protein [Streptomyces sp. NPDC056255]|uniref:hypothetical protein n=1 Tax=Streptomyces sp. NPDC056255 TaxID=3345764 RepID=UPI0035DA5A2D